MIEIPLARGYRRGLWAASCACVVGLAAALRTSRLEANATKQAEHGREGGLPDQESGTRLHSTNAAPSIIFHPSCCWRCAG